MSNKINVIPETREARCPEPSQRYGRSFVSNGVLAAHLTGSRTNFLSLREKKIFRDDVEEVA